MPKLRNDDDAPRRRRATAAAVAEGGERGLAMRLLLSSPKDFVAALLASAAVVAIVTNAIFMQAGHHPSPMFGRAVSSSSVSVITMPRPRPADAEPRPDTRAFDQKLLEPTVTELKPAEPKAGGSAAEVRPAETRSVDVRHPEPRPAAASTARARAVDTDAGDPLGHLVRSTVPQTASLSSGGSAAVPRPPAAIPSMTDAPGAMSASARRVAAVQRALTQYGYGQLKPTGTVGSDTQAAIQRFERARRLPVTGQVSDRLVRELGTVIGRPIE